MQFLVAIFAMLVAAATWYSRLRMIGSLGRDAKGLATRLSNLPAKYAFMRRASHIGLKAVDDPTEAASILLVLMAGARAGQDIPSDAHEVVQAEMCKIFEVSEDEAEDLITHAVWMVRNVELVSGVVLRMTQIVQRTPGIGPHELTDLYEMLVAVGQVNGAPTKDQQHILDVFGRKIGIS